MVPYFLFLLTKQISLVVEKEGTVFHGYEVITIRNVLVTIRNTLVVTKQKYFFLGQPEKRTVSIWAIVFI